jgi:hypothetical protein
MDRDGTWGSMMSCLESIKEYAEMLLGDGDITTEEMVYYEHEIGLIEDTTRDIKRRWEAVEAADIEAHTFHLDLREQSTGILELLCLECGVNTGTKEEMIARLLE